MSIRSLIRRFQVRGVFWRQILRWGIHNLPMVYEPVIELAYTCFFFVVAVPARRAVTRNLASVLPGSTWLGNSLRTFRVFWNFAWTITEADRYKEAGTEVDWEFEGYSNFRQLVDSPEGAIILTAHMGNYDLGAYLFAHMMKRGMTMVRAPEPDPQTQEYVAERRDKAVDEKFRVGYSTQSDSLAFELVDMLQSNEIVAIQGDRVMKGIATFPVRVFDVESALPSGPFALAMATRTLIYPLFIIRLGRRRYRLLTYPPIECSRTSRDRNRDLERSLAQWRDLLEETVRKYWYQWYMFEPIARVKAS